jgi:hypothetical protein
VITDVAPPVEVDEPSARRPRRWRLIALALAVVLVIGGVTAYALWPDRPADVRDGTTLVSLDGLAADHGIKVTLVAVSASGGLIDFRFQVVDPNKANLVMHDLSLYPKLIVEDTGETLLMRTLPHHHIADLVAGRTYFFLLANANNAVHAGTKLTLVMGTDRVEHITAQG